MEPLKLSSAEFPLQPRSKHQLKGVLQCSEHTAEDESIHCDKPGLKLAEAQKLCKYASANDMTNEGIPAAIDNLEKALRFLHLVRNSQADDCNYGVWKPERCVRQKDDEKGESEEGKTKEVKKTVLCSLNKVTSSNVNSILTKLLVNCQNVDTEERLDCVAGMFYEKAIKEPNYAASYVKMCQHLAGIEVASSADPNATTNFRKLLLKKCQREFANTVAELVDIETKKKEIEANKNGSMKKVLEEELEELTIKYRKKTIGNIRFIGELFKLGIISIKVIHLCILRLFDHSYDVSLEGLCLLLKIAGKDLEEPSANEVSSSAVIANEDKYVSVPDDGANGSLESSGKLSLRHAYKDDKRNPVNPSVKKVYDRNFLLQQQNNPASMKKPRGLSTQEVICDKPDSAGMKRVAIGNNFQPPILQMPQLKTKGSTLTASISSRESMNFYFFSLDIIVKTFKISNRVRFMIQDVIDLRKNQWKPRRKDNNQNKCEQIPRSKVSADNSDAGIILGSGGREKNAFSRGSPIGMSQSMIGGTCGDGEHGFLFRPQTFVGPGGKPLRPLRETLRHLFRDILRGVPTVTEDQIGRKAKLVLEDLFTNGNMEKTVLDLKEWLHPSTVSTFINECLMRVLERNRKERKITGTLLNEMVKRKLFTTSQVLKGFELPLQAAEDFLVDIPELWDHLAQLVEPIFEEGVVNIAFLGELAAGLSPSMASDFVAATLKELVNALGGKAGAERLWMLSNTSFRSILPGVGLDINTFVDQHKELEFVKVDSTAQSANIVGNPVARIPSALVYLEFQRNLHHFLSMKKRSAKEICGWIQNQSVETGNPSFIRAMASAIIECCIYGNGTESKLNTAVLKAYSDILRIYVGNVAERQLQLLFSVQTLVTQRQHTKGLIQSIFETLYDEKVISQEGFELWLVNKGPSEQEGKATALKSAYSFLNSIMA